LEGFGIGWIAEVEMEAAPVVEAVVEGDYLRGSLESWFPVLES